MYLFLYLLGMGNLYAIYTLLLVFDYLRRIDHSSIVVCVSPLTLLMMEQSEKFTTQGVSSDTFRLDVP